MSSGEQVQFRYRNRGPYVNRDRGPSVNNSLTRLSGEKPANPRLHFTASTMMRSARTARLPFPLPTNPNHQAASVPSA